jgi:hypothetical protein
MALVKALCQAGTALTLAQLSQDERDESAGHEPGQSYSQLGIHRRPLAP